MAALLVAMAVMTVMLTAAMPVWKTTVQREKEAELIFRGEQYARAIGLFQRKMGPGTMPPSIDLLVEQRYLRKKYKDPITNDDFQILSGAQGAAAQAGRIGGPPGGAQQQFGQFEAGRLGQAGGGLGGRVGQPGQIAGGIMGVVSKSTETSMRRYNNRDKYNEWTFVFVQTAEAAGQGGGGAQRPGETVGPGGRGARGGRGAQPPPGGRGNPFGSGTGLGRGRAGPQTAPGGGR